MHDPDASRAAGMLCDVIARSTLSAVAQRAKADATKQSSFPSRCAKAGLLRGARHRARIHATRWLLAMTILALWKLNRWPPAELVELLRYPSRDAARRWVSRALNPSCTAARSDSGRENAATDLVRGSARILAVPLAQLVHQMLEMGRGAQGIGTQALLQPFAHGVANRPAGLAVDPFAVIGKLTVH